ncbi:MAG TPA: hypothetical protein VF717_14560 [Pyrinomonadaceae bacterium]
MDMLAIRIFMRSLTITQTATRVSRPGDTIEAALSFFTERFLARVRLMLRS